MEIKFYNKYIDEARRVREKVFMEEQGFSYDYDEYDEVATHIVISDGGVPVGALRVFESGTAGVYILGRLAVKKECRKKGIGTRLVEAAKKYVADIGGKILILHSQLQAKEFYLKCGFTEYGEIEYEEDCPHIWMKAEF